MRYSGFKVIKEALTGHKGWTPAWRDPDPKPHYDIVIIGGGGHGLAIGVGFQSHARREGGSGFHENLRLAIAVESDLVARLGVRIRRNEIL